MSGTILAIQPNVPWSPELTAAYTAEAAPSAESCNSALVEVLLIADRLCAGSALMNADRTDYVVETIAAEGTAPPQARVGQYLSRAVLDGADERTTAALALAQVGRSIGATTRPAGWLPVPQLAVVGGVVIAVAAIVGIGVNWYARHASSAAQAERLRQARIVEAGRLTSERYLQAARTGQPPAPPSEIERASLEDVRAAAAEARAAGIGQTVQEAVSGVGKIIGLAVVAALAVTVMNASRR